MRIRLFVVTFLIGLLFNLSHSNAQTVTGKDLSKVKSNDLSDAQILEIYKKYEGQISESDAMSLLIQQGLDPVEAESIKTRLINLRNGGKNIKSAGTGGIPKPTLTDYSRDTTLILGPKPYKRKSPIYGLEFFNNPSLKFEPNIRIATPEGYILGPDDEVNVIFTGMNEASTTGKISPDGYLQVARIGLVYLNGLSVAEAYSAIKKKAQRIAYPALASGQTKLNVTLGTVRSIRVIIIGEVNVPGTFTVSSLSSLFNALYQSGGPNENGSLRKIEVIRGNRVIKTVDLYSFIQTGISSDNVRLQDQDVIRVPQYKKRVALDGEVRKTGLFELKEDETISDLLKYAGGFSDIAYKKIAKVAQVGEKERNVKDVPDEMFDRYILKNADSVYFGAILDRYSNRVNIQGAVYRPGQFELTKNITLKELIQKAEGLRDDASLSTGYIKRTNPNLEKTMLSFNTGAVINGTAPDILLMREDTVMIVSTQELNEDRTITIGGNVRAEGTFIYRKGMTIADALVMANGFTPEAANHRIEVSRLVVNRSDVLANDLIKVYTVSLDSALRGEQANFQLEPLDFIYVPRLVNYRSLGNIKVRGEVLNPGDFPLTRRDETAAEFIARAGGITPNGSLENAQVFRNGVRVGINLLSTNAKQKESSMVLMQGDSLYIPRRMPFVEVAGAVNTPQLLNYSNSNFLYYINAAGGITQNARLKNAFVQYPNGTNQPVKRFLFFKNYPRVVAGSKIIVPENKGDARRLNVVEISAIASGLTALLTVIAIFIK